MTTKSSEEIMDEYVTALGKEFGTALFHAKNEWCDLWLTWKQFKNLFGHGPERVELMNRAGAGFFYRVDKHFFEAVALAVCRLSDPVKSAGKANLTVRLFESFMDTVARKQRMQELLDAVQKSTEFARDWRNRRIGHNDYGLKTGEAVPLEKATLEYMDAAIAALHETLSYVCLEFMGQNLHNEVIDDLNNEMVMLHRLFLGDAEVQKELEELKAGNYQNKALPAWLNN